MRIIERFKVLGKRQKILAGGTLLSFIALAVILFAFTGSDGGSDASEVPQMMPPSGPGTPLGAPPGAPGPDQGMGGPPGAPGMQAPGMPGVPGMGESRLGIPQTEEFPGEIEITKEDPFKDKFSERFAKKFVKEGDFSSFSGANHLMGNEGANQGYTGLPGQMQPPGLPGMPQGNMQAQVIPSRAPEIKVFGIISGKESIALTSKGEIHVSSKIDGWEVEDITAAGIHLKDYGILPISDSNEEGGR